MQIPPERQQITDRNEEIERSWTAVAQERVREIDEGRVELLDGEDVLREMRSMCQ